MDSHGMLRNFPFPNQGFVLLAQISCFTFFSMKAIFSISFCCFSNSLLQDLQQKARPTELVEIDERKSNKSVVKNVSMLRSCLSQYHIYLPIN